MAERASEPRGIPKAPGASESSEAHAPVSPKDHFLQMMFFQAHPDADEVPGGKDPGRATGSYLPLRHSTAGPGERYVLPPPSTLAPVSLDSPATEVMTDLRRVRAVTTGPSASIDEANKTMIAHGVRALLVADEAGRVFGILTSTDILGERPIQFAQERGIHRGEVVVRDIMTPADRLEILDFKDVRRARVGDLVATLRLAGRQHALAVEAVEGALPGQRTVRGIFSLTQVARQLGIAPQQVHDIARTFAEIEAIIGA